MDLKNVPGLARVVIAFIGETIKPNETKNFIKRDIGFTVYETVNGNEYERIYCMQCIGSTDKPQSDKTKMLDNFTIGQVVDVVYSISGSTSQSEKLKPTVNNPGCLVGFNNLTVSRIELYNQQQQPAYQNPMGQNYPQPNVYQQPQQNYQPQPNVYQQPAPSPTHQAASAPAFFPMPTGIETPVDNEGKEMVWNTKTGQWEALPF